MRFKFYHYDLGRGEPIFAVCQFMTIARTCYFQNLAVESGGIASFLPIFVYFYLFLLIFVFFEMSVTFREV